MSQQTWNFHRLSKESNKCSCERLGLVDDTVETISISELKERANSFYKQGRFVEAEIVYLLAIGKLDQPKQAITSALDSSKELSDVNRNMLQVLYSNLSQTRLSLKKFEEAERDANKAIDLYRKGICSTKVLVKSLLRRASALVGMNHLDSALVTLEKVKRLEPDNVECDKIYTQIGKAMDLQNLATSKQNSRHNNILESPQSLLSAFSMNRQPNEYLPSVETTTKSSSVLIQELNCEENAQSE